MARSGEFDFYLSSTLKVLMEVCQRYFRFILILVLWMLKVFIDGPYGTSTREIFETEHAILIGAGIGVTPYASILQSVMYRYKMSRRQCPNCDHHWYDKIPDNVMKMKKVKRKEKLYRI